VDLQVADELTDFEWGFGMSSLSCINCANSDALAKSADIWLDNSTFSATRKPVHSERVFLF